MLQGYKGNWTYPDKQNGTVSHPNLQQNIVHHAEDTTFGTYTKYNNTDLLQADCY